VPNQWRRREGEDKKEKGIGLPMEKKNRSRETPG
jgi:hypothetical protein